MNTIKKILLTTLFVIAIASVVVKAQNIGINSTGSTPAASAMLDISSSDKGLLIPRVALSASNQASPVVSPAISLLIYNTATAGASPNNVEPGFYYWNGSGWAKLLSSSISGNVGIGVSTPQAKLDVSGTYKLGTSGTVLTNLIKTTFTVNDATNFNFNTTHQTTITVAGVTTNATVVLNPRSSLPSGIAIAWCRANSANAVTIGFINTDNTSRSIGNITFDVTIIQ